MVGQPIPLVLLPGLDGTGQLFRQIVTALPAHIVPTVVSYPSDLPLAYAELETIVGEALPATSEFAILAESYSGPLALRIAARRPAGLRAIVLTATFATAPRRWPAWMLWLVSPFRPQHLPAWCVRYSLLGSDAPHALVAEFYDAVSAVQPQVLQARLSDVLSADVREELRTCAYPILYLAATHDRLVSIRASQRMKEIQPAMEIATIKGPHLLLQREPEAAAKQICKFLQRVFANVTPY